MTQEDIAAKFAEHENRIKVSEHRIEDLEHVQGQIQDLTVSVKELAIGVKNLTTTTDDLKVRMDRQEAEPAENMKIIRNQIITSIISIIVGAVATFIMTGM